MIRRYDAIIIGAGQAGPALAARLTQSGQKVALIERHHAGGTCVNSGCIPTKTLVASARAAHITRRARDFGVVCSGDVLVDMEAVKARKDEVVLASRTGVTSWMDSMTGLDLVRGHARFEGNRRIRVGEDLFAAERIFINTGARARVPGFTNGVPYWTNSDMMDVDHLPSHLIIVGAGYIGLEFAQMYRRFGSEVTIVETADRVLVREDEEVSAEVRGFLEDEGVKFRLSAACVELLELSTGVGVRVACEEGPEMIEGSNVLVAVGRVPNTHDLGLETTDIDLDSHGFIQVDDELRTSVENVWALGEVNRRGAFTHTSYNDFEVVAENLLDDARRKVTDRIPIYAVFVDPPLARVGMNDQQARASGHRVLFGRRAMAHVGRARERGETAGFMKVLVDADSGKLLGATIVGTQADEVIHTIAAHMYAGTSYETLRRSVHVHPTVAELLPTVVGALEPLE